MAQTLGANPPDLNTILKELTEYFESFSYFQDTVNKIEKKHNIKSNEDGFWTTEDIGKAWKETKTKNNFFFKKKTRALVIMLKAINQKVASKVTETQYKRKKVAPEPAAVIESDLISGTNYRRNCNLNSTEFNDENKKMNRNINTRLIKIPISIISNDEKKQAENEVCKLTDGVPSLTKTMKKTSYVVQYNHQTRNPAWVFEILNEETIPKTEQVSVKRRSSFRKDPSVDEPYKAMKAKNYTSERFEQGHLAAAANHTWCQQAMDDTFLLTNMSPQKKDLNQGAWKQLEQYCRDLTTSYRNVCVYTGPLYCPDKNMNTFEYKIIDEKAVPTHFFKVIILESKNKNEPLKLEYYKMPNKDDIENMTTKDILKKYETSLDDIEDASGLLFSETNPNIKKIRDEKVKVRWKAKEGNKKMYASAELPVTLYKNDLFGNISY